MNASAEEAMQATLEIVTGKVELIPDPRFQHNVLVPSTDSQHISLFAEATKLFATITESPLPTFPS
jgi:hypothetical protein